MKCSCRNLFIQILLSFASLIIPLVSYSYAGTAPLSKTDSLFVKKIVIQGCTVFSGEELSRITSRYEGRKVSFEELQQLRHELTTLYVDKGYINSGAILPEQTLSEADATVRFEVIEGRLTEVQVSGNSAFKKGYFTSRIFSGIEVPLNLHTLQDRLLVLQQDSRLKRIQAELSPGELPGEGILRLNVAEKRPYGLSLQFGNTQSPALGSYRGDISTYHDNILGIGDRIDGSFGLSNGISDYSFGYTIPINQYDTTIAVRYRQSHSVVVEYPFEDLDIISKTNTLSLILTHPVYRTAQRELRLTFTGDIRREETSLLGIPFSFSEGTDDGIVKFTVLRFSQDWIDRGERYVWAVRSSINAGINAYGFSAASTLPKGSFFTWLSQFQWIYQFNDKGLQTKLRAAMQLSTDPLPPSERFALGGINTVRGYRENLLVRDSGLSLSLELKAPVLFKEDKEAFLYLIPFLDGGSSWNKGAITSPPKSIYSVGIGALWQITDKISLQGYYGRGLRSIENKGSSLQERGVHFVLNAQVF